MQAANDPLLEPYQRLKAYADALAMARSAAETDGGAAAQALLNARQPLSLPSADLATVGRSLADLAAEPSAADRVRFLVGYAEETYAAFRSMAFSVPLLDLRG
jgi:hypothetical protein